MRRSESRTLFRTGSHWGVYDVEVAQGRAVGVRPRKGDPDPPPLMDSMIGAVHDECRVRRPMVRAGWLGWTLRRLGRRYRVA